MSTMTADLSGLADIAAAMANEADAVTSEAAAVSGEFDDTAGQPVAAQLRSLLQHLDSGGQRARVLLDQAAVLAQHQALIQQVHDDVGRLAAAIRTPSTPMQPVSPAEAADKKSSS